MQSAPWKICVVCGLTLSVITGCATYSPYGMNGYNGYPGGVYSTPPAGYAPQPGVHLGTPVPTVVPGVPAYGTQSVPENGSLLNAPSPTGGSQASQSDAPLYTAPKEASAPIPSNDNRVPDPIDVPEEENVMPLDFENKTDEAKFPFGNEGAFVPSDESNRVEMESSNDIVEQSPVEFAFEEPIPVELTEGNIDLVNAEKTASMPNPYDYDRESYEWLRGKVDYDKKDKTWNIIYSLNPDKKDRFGGSITLVDHPDLRELKNEDVVLLEGRIDPDSLDRSGKAKYRISKLLGPLVPSREVSNSREE